MVGAAFAAATEAPGRGWHWGQAAVHADLPRGTRSPVAQVGTLAEVLHGPATDDTGSMNLVGALRRTMALTGYASTKELQKAELVVRG
jgi:IMP dehydrogenase